ncbi:hypothetical protein MRB53_020134 [Persea americana]|uniref:Uncharacterized protein n=1 Tax=Persea americana TaxID=3435 RepID=A0ACC2L0D5_PERAE|nr:hypothetical protein MRB53_020134 [Persea americana]
MAHSIISPVIPLKAFVVQVEGECENIKSISPLLSVALRLLSRPLYKAKQRLPSLPLCEAAQPHLRPSQTHLRNPIYAQGHHGPSPPGLQLYEEGEKWKNNTVLGCYDLCTIILPVSELVIMGGPSALACIALIHGFGIWD